MINSEISLFQIGDLNGTPYFRCMSLNLWSIILVASLSQCVFLGVMFSVRPPANKKALALLLGLLLIILLININNLWYASYLYRVVPGVAGFARGMVLLLGPLVYFYVRSITLSSFRFHWKQLLHSIPYLLVLTSLLIQDSTYTGEELQELVDVFMAGEMPVSFPWIIRFIVYVSHLLLYLYLTRQTLRKTTGDEEESYLVSLKERITWVTKITGSFYLIAPILALATVYMAWTKTYTADGNFIITTALSAIIYLIGYQALIHNQTVLPGFDTRYASVKLTSDAKDNLLEKLMLKFEQEKVFTNPDIKLSSLADQLNTHPHVLSRIINTQLNQSFSELLNKYRIEEFKKKAVDPDFAHFSIIGIAYEVGYNSKSSFNTAFKKQTGLTPSQFLKKD